MSLTAITVIVLVGLFSSSNITELEPNRISITDVWEAQFEGIEYQLYRYDCKDFTHDFKATLEGYDMNVSYIYGKYDNNLHYWLEINGIWFEATSGHWIEDRSHYTMSKYIKWVW